MKIDITLLTENELIDLNRRIVERLRFLSQTRAHFFGMSKSVAKTMVPLVALSPIAAIPLVIYVNFIVYLH